MASSGADRAKAMRIRAKVRTHQAPTPEEAAWLADYEREQEATRAAVGASQTKGRRVQYTEEEHEATAIGTGAAAEVAAAAAMTREEGRRLDLLINTSITALTKACEMHQQMAATLLARSVDDSRVQRSLLEAVRDHYLSRVEAEAEATRIAREAEQADKGGTTEQLIEAILPAILARLGMPTITPAAK